MGGRRHRLTRPAHYSELHAEPVDPIRPEGRRRYIQLYLSTIQSDKTVAVSVLLSNGGRRAGKERGVSRLLSLFFAPMTKPTMADHSSILLSD
jgi:hypothetical protein